MGDVRYRTQSFRLQRLRFYCTYENNRTWRVISVIAENKPYAHHKTHLHTVKVVAILIPRAQLFEG